ncbi:hypothetical protein PROFUN_07128 [Planoprotostelium fungivorum]|uniref:Uncharacterized protein n=1 Tax=Planoprotostelium fungivorum TaxID=1890364 RepID=A0A2P6NMJ1_9EUKA|nr:hypothetical protein PROFUN_07128 [Planoprotostelium fungivorum]
MQGVRHLFLVCLLWTAVCPCGEHKVMLRLRSTNGTWLSNYTTDAKSNDIVDTGMEIGGRYVMYATGVCVVASDTSVGGYGRTITRDIDLTEASTSNRLKYIVGGSILGGLLIIIIIGMIITLWKKRQRIDYVQLQ